MRHAGGGSGVGGGWGASARGECSLCELARRVNSLRGATGEGTERERLPRKAVKAVRSPAHCATTDRPAAAVAPSPAPLRRSAFRCYFVVGK